MGVKYTPHPTAGIGLTDSENVCEFNNLYKSMFRGSMIYSWSEKEETVENMISEVNLEFS